MIIGIVAVDHEWGIAKDGDMPWSCPEDLKHFKRTTNGSNVVMGRVTWDTLPIKPLPGRNNIVISRNSNLDIGDVVVSDDIVWPANDEVLYVIGGLKIYKLYEPYYDRFHVTSIKGQHNCDVF